MEGSYLLAIYLRCVGNYKVRPFSIFPFREQKLKVLVLAGRLKKNRALDELSDKKDELFRYLTSGWERNKKENQTHTTRSR